MVQALVSSLGVWVLLPSAFWMLMIFDCVRNEPDRQTWLYILMFLNIAGAIVYFFACWLPRANVPMPNYFKRWSLRQALWNAEAAVAYQQALEKEPGNPHALWGAAFIELKNKQFAAAKDHLEALLTLDRDYKTGEASLLYGKALFELGDWEPARSHLEKDIKH